MHVKNKKISVPKVVMVDRPFNKNTFINARLIGLSPIAAKILANRNIDSDPEVIKNIINPTFKKATFDIYKLKDIEKSANRISDAIINNENIALLCDFDVDGISSAAVLYSAFIDYFNFDPQKLHIMISHRMMYGYGFREEILNDIMKMNEKPTLLITADQGSSDEERINKYNKEMEALGYEKHDVIVTDHHHIKGKGPKSAFAVVNPQREDDEFEDKTICGCTVALFVMNATRDSLIKKGYLAENSPRLTPLLTYSTAATIADCVSMASPLNRAIVKKGLQDISEGKIPAWKIMLERIVGERPVDTDAIGFGLGPRINACSRTGGDGLVALKYYLSESDNEALRYLDLLENMNEDRKKTEKELVEQALIQASELYLKNYFSVAVYLPNGHHGIHGIAASKISEKYGRPTVLFSPKEYDDNGDVKVISGSGRSIEGLDLYNILKKVEERDKTVFIGYGGHSMAAGMTIPVDKFDTFRLLFEEETKIALNYQEPFPKILIDGELKQNINIDFNLLDEVLSLRPYGNGFESPIFKAKVLVVNNKVLGKNQDTLQIDFIHNNLQYKGIMFKYDLNPIFNNIELNQTYYIAFSINESFFKGNRQLNIIIFHMERQ